MASISILSIQQKSITQTLIDSEVQARSRSVQPSRRQPGLARSVSTRRGIFSSSGLTKPKPKVAAASIILRARLVAAGPYLSIFLTSVLRQLLADHYAVTALPVVDLPENHSVRVVTLKNRTLSPVVERFLVCVREVAALVAGKQGGRAARSSKSKVSLRLHGR
jgi:DNA-binding transcriptional LysR family regulator